MCGEGFLRLRNGFVLKASHIGGFIAMRDDSVLMLHACWAKFSYWGAWSSFRK